MHRCNSNPPIKYGRITIASDAATLRQIKKPSIKMVFYYQNYLFQNSSQVIFPDNNDQIPKPAKYKKAISPKTQRIIVKSIIVITIFLSC